MPVDKDRFFDALTNDRGTFSIRDVSKYAVKCGVPTDGKHIYEWLRENGYLCTTVGDWNCATKECMDEGYITQIVDYECADGKLRNVARVTGKGLRHIIDHMHDELVVKKVIESAVN